MIKVNRSKEEEEKLQKWCQKTWPKLYNYLYYRVQNREEAEDLTQEIYARALTKFTFTQELPTLGYLKTIALNLVRDRWRRQKVQGVQVDLEDRFLSCQSQEEAAINKNFVRELLNQLPEEQRKVLELRIYPRLFPGRNSPAPGKKRRCCSGLAVSGRKSSAGSHGEFLRRWSSCEKTARRGIR